MSAQLKKIIHTGRDFKFSKLKKDSIEKEKLYVFHYFLHKRVPWG